MATSLTQAVIIDGPRRGQIISLPEEQANGLPTEEEVRLLQLFIEQVDVMADEVAEMKTHIGRTASILEHVGDEHGPGQ